MTFDEFMVAHGGEYDEVGEAFGAWLADETGHAIIGGPAGEPPTFVATPRGDEHGE